MRFDSLYEINFNVISIYSSNYAFNSSVGSFQFKYKKPHFNLSPQTILSLMLFIRRIGLTAILVLPAILHSPEPIYMKLNLVLVTRNHILKQMDHNHRPQVKATLEMRFYKANFGPQTQTYVVLRFHICGRDLANKRRENKKSFQNRAYYYFGQLYTSLGFIFVEDICRSTLIKKSFQHFINILVIFLLPKVHHGSFSQLYPKKNLT